MMRTPWLLAALLLAGPPVDSACGLAQGRQDPPARPNILWVTCEDISPNVGCYGDAYAVTPNIDRLASEGVRYLNAFAPIGVCAPSRSTLIMGTFAPSVGTHHMRCAGTLPSYVRCFPEYLRKEGYYCTNNVKTDYNFSPPAGSWDESSGKAHWRKRRPGQPFFSVFNFTSCHESQIRMGEAEFRRRTADFTDAERHDPSKAPVPPYHPDTPEVRRDWARYADNITFMDKQVGQVLRDLREDGLEGETIVFYFSDHGAGMPRSKRWLYDSSLRVPMVVRFPERYEHLAPGKAGTATDRLVVFADYGPTVLNLAGVKVPAHMQGKPFLGEGAAAPREYVFGFRDRMDERYDMLRSARDKRYKYIRNFMPHLTWAQHVSYMFEMPTMKVWRRLADEGRLGGPQAIFFSPAKPAEELYDTVADPHEVKNLAADPEHAATLERMRTALREWMLDIRDLGFLPEGELRARFKGRAAHEVVRADPKAYPLGRLMEAADLANRIDPECLPKLEELLSDSDPAVRYWGAVGCRALGAKSAPAAEALRKAVADPCGDVQVTAADALAVQGKLEEALPVLIRALTHENEWVRLRAAIALDDLGGKAAPARDALREAAKDKNQYVQRVVGHALR